MAFKLTPAEIKERDSHLEVLEKKYGEIADAVREYNGALADARGFCETVAGRMREEYDAKSEKWQEGDAASAADAFIGEWEDVSLEDIEDDDIVEVHTAISDLNIAAE